MESSHSVSRSLEPIQNEGELVFELAYTSHKNLKTVAKAALFVGSLLLAGGAVASYFTIGMPGVIAFGVGSAVSIAAFTALCVESCCAPRPETQDERIIREGTEKEENARKARLADQASARERRLAAEQEAAEKKQRIREEKDQFKEMLPDELLSHLFDHTSPENMPAIDSKKSFPAIEGASAEEVARTRILIREAIKSDIKGQLKIYMSHKETPSVADFMSSLGPFLSALNEESGVEKWVTFLELALECTRNKFTPFGLATAFEHLAWPDDDFKMEVLTQVLGNYIALAENYDGNGLFIAQKTEVINLSGETPEDYKLPQNYLRTHRLVLITKNIFDHGDFRESPLDVPESLYAALGYAINVLGDSSARKLRENFDAGSIGPNTAIGIKLVIGQYLECRFPPSMITPLCPYLYAIPGLVGLELSDIGLVVPWAMGYDKQQDEPLDEIGFADEDIQVLLEMLRTNPYLLDVMINTKSMSEKGQDDFRRHWADIWTDYKRKAPPIERLLGIESTPVTEDEEDFKIKIEEIQEPTEK